MGKYTRIIWCSWKGPHHPHAGGAELLSDEIRKRLAKEYEVVLLTSRPKGKPEREEYGGYTIVRVGNKFTVYGRAWKFMRRNYSPETDVIIDEMNTMPFFTQFYTKNPILFTHQLCREIWWHQMRPPLNLLGYLLEPLYLRLISAMPTITVSESTKKDLMRFGFRESKIHIIREGISLTPLQSLKERTSYKQPTLLALGAVRPMKQTHHILKAFEILAEKNPELKLIIAGALVGGYGKKIKKRIAKSEFKDQIEIRGRVSQEVKKELLRSSTLLCIASLKEGWGLTASEAHSQGLPVVACKVDGLRDSVRDNETGVLSRKTPKAMAQAIEQLLSDTNRYYEMQEQALKSVQDLTFDNAYADFKKALVQYL